MPSPLSGWPRCASGRSHVPEHDGSGPAGAPCRPASPTCAPTGRCAPSVVVVAVMVRVYQRLGSSPSSSSPRGTLHAGAAGYAALVTRMDGGHDGWAPWWRGASPRELLPLCRCCSHGVAGDRDRTGWALAPPVLAVAAYGIGGSVEGVEVVALPHALLNERAPAPWPAGLHRLNRHHGRRPLARPWRPPRRWLPFSAPGPTLPALCIPCGAAGRRAGRACGAGPTGTPPHSDVPYGHSVVLTPAALRAGAQSGLRPVEQLRRRVSEHPARRRGHSRGGPGVSEPVRRHLAHEGDRGACSAPRAVRCPRGDGRRRARSP